METLTYIVLCIFAIEIIGGLAITLFLRYEIHWWLEDKWRMLKKGNLTKSPQWWKHLRDWKRIFWKSERKAQKRNIENEQRS